jgi:hypothetical protein
MDTQHTLAEKPRIEIARGPYNKFNGIEQWIRLSEGCPNNCPFCYEPTEIKLFEIPKIVRLRVKIMDMNLLAKPEALDIIRELGRRKVSNRFVHYELICGVDYRFLTPQIAMALKKNRFGIFGKKGKWRPGIRIAWDGRYRDNPKIKEAIDILIRAGFKPFKPREIQLFIIANWQISYDECLKKLDLAKVWGTQVADCYFDNQVSPRILPIYWTRDQIRQFRAKVRKHNQLVGFRIDPQLSKEDKDV